MANHYSPDIYNECKRKFIEEGKSPREIMTSQGGSPTHQTIARWAAKKDTRNDNKTWFDLRDEFQNDKYEALSTKQMVARIYEQIQIILKGEEFNTGSADQLAKLVRILEKISSPSYHIPVMYQFLTEFIEYLKLHKPHLVTEEFMNTTRDFKNQLRSKLL